MVTTKTSPATTSERSSATARRRGGGFTLIEVLIVIAIIAGAMALAAPRLFKKDTKIKPAARHLMVLAREVRNRARLTNSTMRLVIEMDATQGTYWVEKANGPKLIATQEEREEAEREQDEEEKKPADYQMDTLLTKQKKELPSGFRFGSVETINANEPLTDGLAYIHFFPEGLMEAAAIQITDGAQLTWTLIFNPLTGQADILEEARSLKDVAR